MRSAILSGLLFASALCAFGQAPSERIDPAAPTPSPTPETNISTGGGPGLPPSSINADTLTKMRPSQPDYTRPDAETRRKRFISSTVGPFALGRMVASAGYSTWRNSPEEWGPTWEGFGRRVASGFGKNVIKQTTKYGLDEALKYDSHYYRSKDKSVGGRIKNALISPVTARDKNGKRVVGVPNLVGTYTSSIIAYETWYPARYDWKDGVRSGTISLGFAAGFNLFKEFVWKK